MQKKEYQVLYGPNGKVQRLLRDADGDGLADVVVVFDAVLRSAVGVEHDDDVGQAVAVRVAEKALDLSVRSVEDLVLLLLHEQETVLQVPRGRLRGRAAGDEGAQEAPDGQRAESPVSHGRSLHDPRGRGGVGARLRPAVTDEPPATASSRDVLGWARRLRLLSAALELTIWLTVAGSALAFGAVHPFSFGPLWTGCALAAVLALARAVAIAALRRRVGSYRVALHSSGRWLVVDPRPEDYSLGWSCDLGHPALPRGPLLFPGLAFLAFGLLQLVPLPPRGVPVTVSPEDTRLGLAFVAVAPAASSGGRRTL